MHNLDRISAPTHLKKGRNMVMMRITTAVDRRLGFGYGRGYHNRAPAFTAAPRLAGRLEVFRTKLLKKAIQIELDELAFWVKELKRSQVDFQTVRMLAQRIRTLCEGIPNEHLPASVESEVVTAVRRHVIVFAKQKLRELKKLSAMGNGCSYDSTCADFIRFIRTYGLSLEDLGYSKIQLRHLTQQANLAFDKAYEEHLRERSLRKQS